MENIVDGEMPIEAMQERLLLLDRKPSDNLRLLSHEDLADKKIHPQPVQGELAGSTFGSLHTE
jgi:hypothetical protein